MKAFKYSFMGLLCSVSVITFGQDRSAEMTVRSLYESISFVPGVTPDWATIKTMFVEDAIITLRTSNTTVSVFSVDQWVQDFVDFIDHRNLENIGFQEGIAGISTFEYGEIAHVLVLYEPRIPGEKSKRQGIDSIHLIKQDKEWKIVSILNELPTSERPVPAVLKQ